MYHIGFIIEQVLGHITHARNLQETVPEDAEVAAQWGLLPYEVRGLEGRIPLYRSNWTVRSGVHTRRTLATMARQAPLDALFFHTQVPAMLALDWVRRVPSVISLDATPLQYDQLGSFYAHAQGSPWMERLKWRLGRACFGAAGQLVTWSAWAKESLERDYGVAGEKVTVIPPGVNVSSWLRPEGRKLREGPVKLLFVGGDLERKGGNLLIESFRQLAGLGVELHLVTRDPVEAASGLFVYHGMQPNSPALRQLYHDCDIFVLPTLGDCLPMVLSEAGAAGMAIVSTRVAAIPEVVRHEETGLLVPVGDGAALTAALRRLVEAPELRLRLGEQAVAHVAQQYDTRSNTARLLALLKREADRGRQVQRAA